MTEQKSGIRLSRLTIKNYKKLDSLEIDFPRPVMSGDADILVLGSKNGGGKTSVLECCALLILGGMIGYGRHWKFRDHESLPHIIDLLIKSGQNQADIEGEFERNGKTHTLSFRINRRNGFLNINDESDELSLFDTHYVKSVEYSLNSILSFSSEPFIVHPLLYFNSYRKTQESKPELGMMADDHATYRMEQISTPLGRQTVSNPVSSFKLEILRALLGKKSVFGKGSERESELVLSQLNSLIQRYCGGKIEHLRPLPDNKFDIRIEPSNGGESFSFDGLSSGQKEMIATLFLIWKNTQNQPSIVLIDEPELHLNAEWHRDFVKQLYKLAPQNQYILATHSETIFRSVDKNYRAILVPDDKELSS